MPLFLFLNVMRVRTEHFDEQRQANAQAIIRQLLAIKMRQQERSDLQKVLPHVKWVNRGLPADSVATAITHALLLCDLKVKLLLAPESHHFIASDHPVVVLNQGFRDIVKGRSVGGIAMRGLQIFLPLSPELAIIAFDSKCYRVGRPDQDAVALNHSDDVWMINALQVLNCHKCIYFRHKEDREICHDLVYNFSGKRVSIQELTSVKNVFYQGQNQLLIHSQVPSLSVPGKWSFCKVRRTFRPEDFNYREPGTVKAVKAWEEASGSTRNGSASTNGQMSTNGNTVRTTIKRHRPNRNGTRKPSFFPRDKIAPLSRME
jgi:Protein of unknown function (DUF4238)